MFVEMKTGGDWILDHKFVRDNHVLGLPPAYEGESTYAWDAGAKRLVYRYVSNARLLLNDTMERQGNQLVSPGRFAGAKRPGSVRAVWRRFGDSAYRAESFEKAGGDWKPMFIVECRRITR